MRCWMPLGWILIFILTNAFPALAQAELAKALAELTALTSKVGSADTRTRVDAMHRVRWIALSRTEADVKLKALELLREPVGTVGQMCVHGAAVGRRQFVVIEQPLFERRTCSS